MENFKFFQNNKCEYFPCHNIENTNEFNCLFCFCPLYTLKDKCGGSFKYLENGMKDCSLCIKPHQMKSHDFIMSKVDKIIEKAKL